MIEDMEFMILVFIIVMILWLNCFEDNWNVRSPEEKVCLCDSCRAGESVFHGEYKRSTTRASKVRCCLFFV